MGRVLNGDRRLLADDILAALRDIRGTKNAFDSYYDLFSSQPVIRLLSVLSPESKQDAAGCSHLRDCLLVCLQQLQASLIPVAELALGVSPTYEQGLITARRKAYAAATFRDERTVLRHENTALRALAEKIAAASLSGSADYLPAQSPLRIDRGGRRALFHDRRTIGILAPVSHWATEYYVNIVKAIRKAIEREPQTQRPRLAVLDVLREEFDAVDAILSDSFDVVRGLISINCALPEHLRQPMIDEGIPVVHVTHLDPRPPVVHNVLHTHVLFEALISDLIVGRGSQAAVFVTKGLENPYKGLLIDGPRQEKREAFSRAATLAGLKDAGTQQLSQGLRLEVEPGTSRVIEVPTYAPEFGRACFDSFVRPLPKPTAVFMLSDTLAAEFRTCLHEQGSSLEGEGILLVGFDNSDVSRWLNFTSVDYQLDIVGRVAFDRLGLALEYPGKSSSGVDRVEALPVLRQSTEWLTRVT